ncbi:MAG: DUF4384 domain-containing protein [FCB group bacterium]|nr:DUF4384 domain-containing protein [FCB group bacterium]
MKRLCITLMAALILLPAAASADNLVREYRQNGPRNGDLEVEVWADNEDGIYYEGEGITVFFQANRDCFVAIYTVDTQGDVNLLFPGEKWENGFIRGGEVYSIPGGDEDYDLIVSGPEGIEHIQAVASEIELDIPAWYGGAPIACEDNDDRDDFIEYVNDRYFSCRWDNCERAYDQALIYVKVQRHYYQPVYSPPHWYDYDRYSMMYIDYPYGAEIYIDGIYFGIAPLWIPRVIYGYHWFTIYDRYGYCWESHIQVHHNRTIYLDRSRVKTTKSHVSRYKNLRVQPTKYNRSSYVVSEKRVKSTRAIGKNTTSSKYKGSSYRSSGSKKDYSGSKASSSSKSGTNSKKYRPSSKKSSTSKSLWNSSGSKKSNKSSGYKKSTGKSSKSGKAYKPSSSSKKSSSGTNKSGSAVNSGKSKSSGAKKSTGAVKKSGTTKKSGGSKSTTPKKSSGSYKSSPRSSGTASSTGRVSTGRGTSGKSSSGGKSSRGGGKRR